ncbi:hypothetical protein [Sporosarcina sp. SAFN-015]|uniref:hypothetical protein n=1 Tax=Sporosarcina sp. SAFN-015 TaxID=3387274 RepID=UPI003F814C13
MKKPFYKRWATYLYAFLAIVLLGMILPDAPDGKPAAENIAEAAAEPTAEEKAAAEEQAKKDAEAAARIAEITKKNEAEAAKKAQAKAAEDAKAEEQAAQQTAALSEAYDRLIAESDGVIVSIVAESDYEIVNVRLTDDFAYLPVTLRQQFVDDFGGRIESNTRAQMFEGRGSSDFVYVYFVNSKGEHLAETKHLERGWKVK